MTQLISGIQIYTGEEWLSDGYIRIDDGVIQEVGSGQKAWQKAPDVDSVQDFGTRNILAMPGLVNAHTHTGMMALRGCGDDLTFEKWLNDHILPREDLLSPEDIYYSAIFAQMEMARNGVTAFADMYMCTDEVAKAVDEFGMRASLCRGLVDVDGTDYRLAENLRTFERWHRHDQGRILVGFGPHAPYSCSEGFLKQAATIAKSNDTFIHIHLKESRQEKDQYRFRDLERIGLFDTPTICAHCVHVSDEDVQVLSERGAGVVHNISSNLKLGNGIARVLEMKERGIRVGLGTDGVASNNSLDLWKEMHLCALVHKGYREDPTVFPAEEVYRMATSEGHQILGFDKVGLLKDGNWADIAFVDLDQLHLTPSTHLFSHLVYAGRGSDVVATMVQGRWVYYFGSFPRIDQAKIRLKMEEVFQKVL